MSLVRTVIKSLSNTLFYVTIFLSASLPTATVTQQIITLHLPPIYYLKVDQLGNVGVSDEHLMQQTADETLHLPQVTEQACLWLSVLHAPPGSGPQASLFRFPWHGAPNATQQALCVGPQLLLFGGWQAHLQEELDCCAVLGF